MSSVTEARAAFESELQRLIKQPPQQLTERLIDLLLAIRSELKKKEKHNGR